MIAGAWAAFGLVGPIVLIVLIAAVVESDWYKHRSRLRAIRYAVELEAAEAQAEADRRMIEHVRSRRE